ncbi:thiamine pyrophosphate-binding protein [Candidatus Bathyarchaeota archaeon]|nr:thiamine pyrophosphate-binding protein [Candidatus Bathyarchaeota archaeon]
MKAANGLVRILKTEGVQFVSTFPTCVINNACGEEGMPLIMMRDERFATAVADAYSRVTGGKRIGVSSVMGGLNAAGAQMAFGGLAQAFEDNSPMLCVTDGVPPSMTQRSHFDVIGGFQSVTKWVGYINQPDRVPEMMRRAFTYLRTGRPQPVMLQIPRGFGDYDEARYPYTAVKGWKYPGDPRDVEVAVRALTSAASPVIYAGQGIFYADACDELREFAELVQAPVVTTLLGKSCFPENHPLSAGVRGLPSEHYLQSADVVFAIGSSLSPGRFSHYIPNPGQKILIQSTVDYLDINKDYAVNHAIVGDAKLVLRQMIDEAKKQTGGSEKKRPGLVEEIAGLKKKLRDEYMPKLTSNEVPINPYRVYWDLMNTLDLKKSAVSHDSGNTRDQLSALWESPIPHGYLGWGNVSTLGFGFAYALAAKLANPEWAAVNVTGDAGVGYQMGNYEAAVRHKIGVTTVHINNSGFGGYGKGFWGTGHDPYTSAVSPSSILNMAAATAAMGEYSERIEKPDEIVPAVKRALAANASGRPAYLEFICSQYPVYPEWIGPHTH